MESQKMINLLVNTPNQLTKFKTNNPLGTNGPSNKK